MTETETIPPVVVIEPLEAIDNETVQLNLKYESVHLAGAQTLRCLDAMRKERQLCDVILTVEGHELFAHRAVLSSHSNYFLELFLNDETDTSTKKQLYYQIDGLEHLVLKLIIQFIYQGSFQLTSDMVPKVYSTAHQLRVETIVKACSNYLTEQLTEHTCLSTRLLAMDDDLRSKANDFIQDHFFAVLETREFHALPSLKLELVDFAIPSIQVMCDLVLSWVVQRLRKDKTVQEIGDYLHLLYLSDDKTLHDCMDMEEGNIYFSDAVKDYQSYRSTKRTASVSSTSSNLSEGSAFEAPNVQLVNNYPPAPTPNNSYSLETKLIHVAQSTEHSYITIAIVTGKMLSITIHVPPVSLSAANTTEIGEATDGTRNGDDLQMANNLNVLTLTTEKEAHLASLSVARCGFGIVSTNDAIYAVGGYDRGDCLDTIERYDPSEAKWTLLAAPMISRRGRVSAAVLNDKIYVCGGSDGQKELSTGEYLDLQCTEKWLPIKDLDTPVAHGAMCSDDSYVYLIGGCEGDTCRNTCHRYDPTTNLWSPLSPMNYERSQAAAVHHDGKLYVFGGYQSSRCLSSCEILTLSTSEWSIGPAMRESRRGCSATVFQNRIFIAGGSNGVSSLTLVEIFDPVANEWLTSMSAGELQIPRVGVGITVCQDKLYAIGGFDGRSFLKSIEVYDQNDHRWKLGQSRN